jgi:hypothetical protein
MLWLALKKVSDMEWRQWKHCLICKEHHEYASRQSLQLVMQFTVIAGGNHWCHCTIFRHNCLSLLSFFWDTRIGKPFFTSPKLKKLTSDIHMICSEYYESNEILPFCWHVRTPIGAKWGQKAQFSHEKIDFSFSKFFDQKSLLLSPPISRRDLEYIY